MTATYRESWQGPCRWIVLDEWVGKVPLPESPDGWESLPGAEIRKTSGKKVTLTISDPGGSFIVKIYKAPGGLRRILSFARPSSAFREVALFRELEARGVSTSLPVAAGERRGAGSPGPSCLVAHPAPGATSLDLLLLDGQALGAERRRLLAEYGVFARQVHDRGVLQEDFDPNNAIAIEPLDGPKEILLVDMERVSLGLRLSRRVRARNLARLLRYGRGLPLTEQVRFLRGYVAGEEEPRGALREWAGAIRTSWSEVIRRDRVRMRKSCLRPGRLFARIERGEVRGIFRVRFGEREEPIFGAAHLGAALGRLEKTPLPSEAHPMKDPIVTRVGSFDATLVPCDPDGPRLARRRWQETNANLKVSSPEDLPLALLEVRQSAFRRRGFLLTARCQGYRPPPR